MSIPFQQRVDVTVVCGHILVKQLPVMSSLTSGLPADVIKASAGAHNTVIVHPSHVDALIEQLQQARQVAEKAHSETIS